jgi:hypothetical protein
MTTIVFGDSFIGPLTLINDPNLLVYKFTGASIKGLLNNDNENRKKIIKVLNNHNNIKCMLFMFGYVDLCFRYYYNKFVKKKIYKMNSLIKEYVEFISKLECNNCCKMIFQVFPSTIKDEHVFDSLINYKILTKEHVKLISNNERNRLSNFNFRYKMYNKFNNLIKKYCKIYNINFINLDKSLLNDDKTLKLNFYNSASIYNIHLLWEPLIPILLSKIKICNIKKIYKEDLIKTLEKYIKKNKKEIDIRIANDKKELEK